MGVKSWITNCCVIFGGPCGYIQYKQKLNLVSLFSSCPSLLERGRKGKGGGGGANKRPYETVCDSGFSQLFHLQIKHFLIPIHDNGWDSLRTQTYFQSSLLFILKVNWVGRNAPQLKIRLGSQARGSTYIWRFILEAYYRLGWIKETRCFFYSLDVPDPIALYPLNAAYTSSDMMGNQPAGTTSNVQYAEGPDGTSQGSYQFWGVSNSYIELPNNGGLDTQYSMTMCMWVFPEDQDGPLFNYRPSGSWATHLFLAGDGKFFCRFTKRNDVMMDSLVSPSALNTGQWSYVGCSYDYSTGLARAWVGETEVRTRYLEITSLSTAYNVRLGVKIDDSRYFRGRIARVQVYNIALNLGQFTAVKFRGAS